MPLVHCLLASWSKQKLQPNGASHCPLLQLLARCGGAGQHPRRRGGVEVAAQPLGDEGEVRRVRAAVDGLRRRLPRLLHDDDLRRLGLHSRCPRARAVVAEAGVGERGVARGAVALHEHLAPSLRSVVRPRVGRAGGGAAVAGSRSH